MAKWKGETNTIYVWRSPCTSPLKTDRSDVSDPRETIPDQLHTSITLGSPVSFTGRNGLSM